ncbi:MAG: hypothetical protein SCABRO_00206, partial [Candidatus Scalindua brodae]
RRAYDAGKSRHHEEMEATQTHGILGPFGVRLSI